MSRPSSGACPAAPSGENLPKLDEGSKALRKTSLRLSTATESRPGRDSQSILLNGHLLPPTRNLDNLRLILCASRGHANEPAVGKLEASKPCSMRHHATCKTRLLESGLKSTQVTRPVNFRLETSVQSHVNTATYGLPMTIIEEDGIIGSERWASLASRDVTSKVRMHLSAEPLCSITSDGKAERIKQQAHGKARM